MAGLVRLQPWWLPHSDWPGGDPAILEVCGFSGLVATLVLPMCSPVVLLVFVVVTFRAACLRA
jgi:hypothetical protein